MKFKIIVFTTILFVLNSFSSLSTTNTNILYNEYVKNGLFNYSRLMENPKIIEQAIIELNSLNKREYSKISNNAKLSWLINLYNTYTIKLILDNYPIKSIRKITSPWDKKIVPLFGKKVSLNYIEHSIIRKEFKEPRIHFALVCAAISCPPIRTEAYTANNLEIQLLDQEKIFLNNKDKNFIKENTLYLSKIFKWYGDDFNIHGSLKKYLANYYKLNKVKIKYNDYNWDLNGK